MYSAKTFQSTLSQGERQEQQAKNLEQQNHFNPRSRKESDEGTAHGREEDDYFNPRSRKESDCSF